MKVKVLVDQSCPTLCDPVDNKYPKAKIKNLEQRSDSQKYNIKNTKQNQLQKL